jgi:hypothetical protein
MEWWQVIAAVAGALTAVFTGTFAGLAIYSHSKRLRLHFVGYGKQVVDQGRFTLYSAIIEKRGNGVPRGCQGAVLFGRSQVTRHLFPVGAYGTLERFGVDEDRSVPTYSGIDIFWEGPPPDRGITHVGIVFIDKIGPNMSAKEYDAAKRQKITFTISSDNAMGFSRTVSFADIIAKAKETPLREV